MSNTAAANNDTPTTTPFVPAVYESFVDAIGNTPLIYLRGASQRTGCHIYGKAEFLNPGTYHIHVCWWCATTILLGYVDGCMD